MVVTLLLHVLIASLHLDCHIIAPINDSPLIPIPYPSNNTLHCRMFIVGVAKLSRGVDGNSKTRICRRLVVVVGQRMFEVHLVNIVAFDRWCNFGGRAQECGREDEHGFEEEVLGMHSSAEVNECLTSSTKMRDFERE